MRDGNTRRKDKLMPQADNLALLDRAFCARIATADSQARPYVVPNLFVRDGNRLLFHTARAAGHFHQNISENPRACLEVDEPGEIFAYGEFECDTSVSYESVIVFGPVRVVDDDAEKARFFDLFMAKYGGQGAYGRPTSFYPRLHQVTVYELTMEIVTGKRTPLPAQDQRYPARNQTRSPGVKPPHD
jgi:nitroimidazol reductase NimA-like FMN-containing flavoprotein (pyridoxamine 5'-phosphate oxidase superfamily)